MTWQDQRKSLTSSAQLIEIQLKRSRPVSHCHVGSAHACERCRTVSFHFFPFHFSLFPASSQLAQLTLHISSFLPSFLPFLLFLSISSPLHVAHTLPLLHLHLYLFSSSSSLSFQSCSYHIISRHHMKVKVMKWSSYSPDLNSIEWPSSDNQLNVILSLFKHICIYWT